MNKANTKIIALLLVIPLLLIFTMTSVVKTTTLAVDIPVSSVEILGEDVVDIDLAEEENSYTVETAITPINATNQNVVFETSQVGDEELAEVVKKDEKDGKVTIVAKSLGSVFITAVAGNGRTDTIRVNFTSSLVADVSNAGKEDISLKLGETDNLAQSKYLTYKGALGKMEWKSADESVAKVENSGLIRGDKAGTTTVSARITGLSVDENGVVDKAHEYVLSYDVTVEPTKNEATGFTFLDCKEDKDGKYLKPTMDAVSFSFECDDEKLSAYGSLQPYSEYDEIKSYSLTESDGVYTLDVTLNSTAKMGEEYTVEIWSQNVVTLAKAKAAPTGTRIHTFYVKKGYFSYAELQARKQVMRVGEISETILDLSIDKVGDASVTTVYQSSDDGVLLVENVGGKCKLTAKAEGEAQIKATVTVGTESYETEAILMEVVNPVTSISFAETTAAKNTMENVYTVAGNEVAFTSAINPTDANTYKFYQNGAISSASYVLQVSAKKYVGGTVDVAEDILWTTSNAEIATVENGVVTVKGDGKVTLTARGAYNDALGEDTAKASVTLQCVKNGVWVDDYYTLTYATEKGLPMVLSADVMLAPLLKNYTPGTAEYFSDYKNYLNNFATQRMRTTADATYYLDHPDGKAEDMNIRYAVSFTANVYGNGHEINAEYITTASRSDRFGYGVYNGPLNLVQLKYGSMAPDNAAVKAQDNIVFLMNTAGVTLSNVELKGCSDDTLIDTTGENAGNANLSNLDNIGTVLEIVEDDCQLLYSRVNNGRTVVRIFGKQYEADESKLQANPDAYRIRSTISNCILEYGREFILKLSSNQIKKMDNSEIKGLLFNDTKLNDPKYAEEASPFFTDANGEKYTSIGTANDDYFYNNYVMTDVTLKDTAFTTAGLFCVGFESRFAGICLHGVDYNKNGYNFSEIGWGNVAGTSYAARLKMEGDVRFYDWKKVDDINSETLVEMHPNSNLPEYIKNILNLDVSKLIREYAAKHPDEQLIAKQSGSDWVNGAIAFYGGGKNYSYVDESGKGANYTSLANYSIPLELIDGGMGLIRLAAGQENFRFNLYDNGSSFTVERQLRELADNTAYTWVYAK